MNFLTGLVRGFDQLSGPIRATVLVTVAGTLFTLTMSAVRQVSPGIHVFEVVLFRSIFGVLFMLPWIIRQGPVALRTSRPGLLALRGAIAFMVSVFLFSAALLMPLADLTAVNFTRPILTSIAAILFLGEVVRLRRWTAIIVGFIGTLVIIRPGFQDINPGVLFVLGAVAGQTWNSINIKRLTRTEAPDTIVVYYALFILPLALVPALFVWTTPDLTQLGWLALIGLLGILTQRAITRAFAATDTTVVMAVGFTRLPIAAVIGFVLFSEVPEIWVWIGGTLILVSSVYIAHRESVAARESKNIEVNKTS